MENLSQELQKIIQKSSKTHRALTQNQTVRHTQHKKTTVPLRSLHFFLSKNFKKTPCRHTKSQNIKKTPCR